MKKTGIFILIICLIFGFSNFIKADVISINAGGTNDLIITPDTYIEGFFSSEAIKCIPNTCASLGYSCGSWSDGCGGTLNCGTCASGYTCSAGTCVAVPPGGGGGGGGGAVTPTISLEIVPVEFNIRMAVNTNKPETIKIKNIGTSTATVSVSQQNLNGKVIINETSLKIARGETKTLDIIFVAPSEPGIYTGKILIGNREVLVSLNVKTKLLLFDSNIVVLNKDYKVSRNDKLKTQIVLVPMGDKERLDVRLDYVIKNYDGKVYITHSETVFIENRISFNRDFDVGSLPLGSYIVGLELVYPGGVAPSSAYFEIVSKTPEELWSNLIFYLMILILIVAILIIILLIKRISKKRKMLAGTGTEIKGTPLST
jgi:hypothetical protein